MTVIEGGRAARVRDEVARLNIQPGRMLLAVLMTVFWALGWVVRKAVLVAVYALASVAVAVKLGWSDAGPADEKAKR